MFCPCFATNLPKPLVSPTQVNGDTKCFVCQGHFINICSTSHQHMFYVPSTYVLRLINICSTVINISSTSHLHMFYFHRRLIYEGSTSHLRGTLKRNESMFRLSPNQVVLAAFSCTKQVDSKPKQLAWACHLLAKYLPSPCHLLAISLRSTCQPFAISLRNPGLSFPFLFLISLDGFHRVKLNCLSTSLTSY